MKRYIETVDGIAVSTIFTNKAGAEAISKAAAHLLVDPIDVPVNFGDVYNAEEKRWYRDGKPVLTPMEEAEKFVAILRGEEVVEDV